jgi:hypothetical protein
MNFKQLQHRNTNLTSLTTVPQFTNRHARHAHIWDGALSRRQFMRTAAGAGAAGLVLGSGFFSTTLASGSAAPKPIPDGQQLLFPPDPTVFHVNLPGLPGFPDNDPATNNPSTITDFNGDIGLAYVNGMGTHTDLTTGEVTHLPFQVDLRFMIGEYIGEDGRHHHGAFALI